MEADADTLSAESTPAAPGEIGARRARGVEYDRLPGISINYYKSGAKGPWFVELKYTDRTTTNPTRRMYALNNGPNRLDLAPPLGHPQWIHEFMTQSKRKSTQSILLPTYKDAFKRALSHALNCQSERTPDGAHSR